MQEKNDGEFKSGIGCKLLVISAVLWVREENKMGMSIPNMPGHLLLSQTLS